MSTPKPIAIVASQAPLRAKSTNYPKVLADRVAGREKRVVGDVFGLTNFGVNLTRLAPGSASSLRHGHAKQDELVYVLEGTPTLITNAGETPLEPGMCAGFKAGDGDAHQLVNRSERDVVFLEIGDRTAGDSVEYPDDDFAARLVDGTWKFTRKDGSPF